jgi:cytochrome P450
MTVSLPVNSEIPSHVPPELVKAFSHISSPGMLPAPGACPYKAIQQLHDGPDIFYSPGLGRMLEGNWVVTRNKHMLEILSNSTNFSSKGTAGVSHLLGESWDMIPLEIDPPNHAKYRKFLNPLFTLSRVEMMSDNISDICVQLIDDIQKKGECEFVGDFSRRFPVRVFMDLMGMPMEDYSTILSWEEKILHSSDIVVRIQGAREIQKYLSELLENRRISPKDDVLSMIATGEVGGEPMTELEQFSMSLFLFVAGADTVASTLGYIFRYLATHAQEQQWLLEDMTRIPVAVEEWLRVYSVVPTSRRVTHDIEVGGVLMKKGDLLSVPLALGNYDEEAFENAGEIKLDRNPNRHIAFTHGAHNCLGSKLARREIITAIEEWIQRMPNFRVPDDRPAVARGGAVFGVDEMHIVWDK